MRPFSEKTEKNNKKKVYKEYPELKKEKLVVYVPTFRTYDEYKFEELIKAFEHTNYKLIVKKHPRTKEIIDTFLETPGINYRGVVIDKKIVKNDLFGQTDDDFYYKMQYLVVLLYTRKCPGWLKIIQSPFSVGEHSVRHLNRVLRIGI